MNLRLKQLRKQHGLRQKDLADKIFATPRIVGSWERGDTPIPLEDASRIADLFDCSLDELAGRTEPDVNAMARAHAELLRAYEQADRRGKAAILAASLALSKEFPART